MAEAHQRQKLERLCRYITRLGVSEQRLSITSNGKVRYQLKTPYRDGTTHVFFEPLDFMARLASLVPKPRINLTRFHGVFAPNSKFRGHLTTTKRGRGGEKPVPKNHDLPDMETLRFKQTWMQALKRVFHIDLECCQHCGKHGEVKVIASIEDPRTIEKILLHLKKRVNTAANPE